MLDLPEFPQFPPLKPINPDDIRKHVPGKNEHFVGMHSSSFSEFSDINGVKSSRGGADVIVNNNGKVDSKHVIFNGDKDTEKKHLKNKINPPSFPKLNFKPLKAFHFEPLSFEPAFHFKPIKQVDLKSHVPDRNEQFVGVSHSSFQHFTNNNGKKSSFGGSDIITNTNGKVDQESVRFNSKDKADKQGLGSHQIDI